MTHKPDPRALARRNRAKPTTTPKPPIAMTPAVAKVFSTPELIESILLYLDMRTLLTTAQRISHAFHAVIASSPLLQRALFFRPTLPARSPSATFTTNPLLDWAFPCLMPVLKPQPMGRYEITLPPSSLFVPAGNYGTDANEVLPMTDTRTDNGQRHLAFTRKGASWRRMLLTQPPATRVARAGMGRESAKVEWELVWKHVDFAESGGLRMGVLFDEVFAMNWSPRPSCYGSRCVWNCHGVPALLLWRVPWGRLGEGGEVVLRDATGEVLYDSEETPGWVGEVDLVLGENWNLWTKGRARPCVHPAGMDGMPERCFLSQQEYWDSPHMDWRNKISTGFVGRKPKGGRGTKFMYQCQEYKPGGALSLPPLGSRRKHVDGDPWGHSKG